MPTDREKNRFSARAKRYANVGTKVGEETATVGPGFIGEFDDPEAFERTL